MKRSIFDEKTLSMNKKNIFKSVSFDEINFNKYIETYRRLLLLNDGNNIAGALKNIQELLSFGEKIFSSQSVAEAFLYFCLHGAATGWILQTELSMPEATVYRVLKRLRALNIIKPAIKMLKVKNSKGGPRPTVWTIDGTSTDEISQAINLHFRTLSPKYRVAENVAQTILDEYMNKRRVQEITYKEIIVHIKEMMIPFKTPDIAELAADYLLESGMKVWR